MLSVVLRGRGSLSSSSFLCVKFVQTFWNSPCTKNWLQWDKMRPRMMINVGDEFQHTQATEIWPQLAVSIWCKLIAKLTFLRCHSVYATDAKIIKLYTQDDRISNSTHMCADVTQITLFTYCGESLGNFWFTSSVQKQMKSRRENADVFCKFWDDSKTVLVSEYCYHL